MFTIEFGQPFSDVPLDGRAELRALLGEVIRTLSWRARRRVGRQDSTTPRGETDFY